MILVKHTEYNKNGNCYLMQLKYDKGDQPSGGETTSTKLLEGHDLAEFGIGNLALLL